MREAERVRKVDGHGLYDEGDGFTTGIGSVGASSSEESEMSMMTYAPGSTFTLASKRVFNVEVDDWREVRI